MREAFAKLDVIGRELDKEQRLEEWIIADPERKSIYGGAIEGIKMWWNVAVAVTKAIFFSQRL